MPDASWSFNGLNELIGDLGRAPGRAVPLARTVLEHSAEKVERDMRADFRRAVGRRLRYLPSAIDHDLMGLSAEIGVNKGKRQGPLGNIAAFGTSRSGPLVNHTKALRRNALAFGTALQRVGEQAANGR